MKTSQAIQLYKTITWSIISFIVTFVVGWYVTGNIYVGASIGVGDRVIKAVIYYGHERYWHKQYKLAKKRNE